MFVNSINSLSNTKLTFRSGTPSGELARTAERIVETAETKVVEKPKSWWDKLCDLGATSDDDRSYIGWDQTQQ